MKELSLLLLVVCSGCGVFCVLTTPDQVSLSTSPLRSMHAFALRVSVMFACSARG